MDTVDALKTIKMLMRGILSEEEARNLLIVSGLTIEKTDEILAEKDYVKQQEIINQT